MKKILAFVLSLIFCLGIFVSCKDEKIYDKIPDLSDEGFLFSDFTNRESEWNYSIFTSYDEFLKSIWASKDNKENIDKTIFDDFVILEATFSNYNYGDQGDHIRYRNLSIEQTTLVLECDYVEDDDKPFYYYYVDYYAIPRSEFGKVSPESITEIKVNINKIMQESESGKETETDQEGTAYFDEIEDFTLRAEAPNSGLYDSYQELLTVLERPLNDYFNSSIFEENYILMINGLPCIPASSKGFSNIGFQSGMYDLGENPKMINPGITIQFHFELLEGEDYLAEDVKKDALIIIPRSLIDESFVGENNVTVFMHES